MDMYFHRKPYFYTVAEVLYLGGLECIQSTQNVKVFGIQS